MKRRVALVGNPNVGKSTIFNGLTGLHQHTGNWAGVTVACTIGDFSAGDSDFSIVDLPGIYSFDIRSAEEAVTRDFIQNQDYEYLLLICDATCLERGLHLLRQAAAMIDHKTAHELPQVILCVNLCDEAKKKGIRIDFDLLEKELGILVIPCCGRTKKGLEHLKQCLRELSASSCREASSSDSFAENIRCRNCPLCTSCSLHIRRPKKAPESPAPESRQFPKKKAGKIPRPFSPEKLANKAVIYTRSDYRKREEQIDRLLTGPWTGGLLMCILLMGVLWLTITGANYPSALLWDLFFRIESILAETAETIGAPQWFIDAFIYGVYRVVAWIVSVMLPPMAIFFPLFTLLEDLGYLPRAAFNMDGAFSKCHACGKQCLTMAMGLGCNAAGVVGCRIIDSPRERLIAILTNSLVPCNGRFPLLLTMVSLFTMGIPLQSSILSGLFPALALTVLILSGVLATLASSWVLSRTLLKGVPSSFTLELPPYRPPQVGKVIVRSVFDRTLLVLGRAVAVAAPAGLIIWVLANITVNGTSLLLLLAGFLDPLGSLMGLDGIILMGFLLGFPANEIVLPIIFMAYLQSGTLVPMDDKSALLSLLAANGWTVKTIVCMAVFSLFHWPCSTTCLTIKKETGSYRWTLAAVLLPTCIGVLLCILTSAVLSPIFG